MRDVLPAKSHPVRPSLYGVLLECAHRDGLRLPRGAASTIWREIDELRACGGDGVEVHILEEVSLHVHILTQALIRKADAEAAVASRVRIAGLTRLWTEVARLRD